MTKNAKCGIIDLKGGENMRLLRKINFEITYLTVLFMGAVSTVGGGVWLLFIRSTENGGEFLDAGLNELTFGAMMHLTVALIIALAQKKRDNR